MGNLKINYTRPFLYKYQRAILDSKARYTVTEAATKVGKTASHIIWLFEQALILKDNQRVWWVAPSIGQAKIAYDRMKVQISNKALFHSNESLRTITLITGSVIEFKTAEKPDNLYGDDVYAAVFDEFTRAREAAWWALRSTLTATGGKCKFIGNAKGRKNWGYKLGQKAKHGAAGHEYFKITAYDAANEGMMTKDGRPFIEEIEEAKLDLPEHVFNELYLAEAGEDAANPFGTQNIAACIKPLSILKPEYWGIDLAKSVDYTVIIGLDKVGDMAYFDRFRKDWGTTKETIIKTVPKNNPIEIDSTGVGDPIVEDLQKKFNAMHGFKYTGPSKQQLMEGLSLAIQKQEIHFTAGPKDVLKDELESFEYVYTRTGVRYNAPDGSHDDCVNALALANKCRIEHKGYGQYYYL
jgi:phage FluMu gp28-like protein